MPDTESPNHILQITDLVTGRRYALRLDPQDVRLPWERMLEKYLKNPPIAQLSEQRRITAESLQNLLAIQDLVYVSDDNGRLHDMFTGTTARQQGQTLAPGVVPVTGLELAGDTEVSVVDLTIDRMNVSYARNWVGFHKSRWKKNETAFVGFVRSALERDHSPAEADSILEQNSLDAKLSLLQALAKRIWEADFESYSRFTGQKLIFKSGDETVRNIMDGGGGVCSEKVQALKFLTDNLGYESEYLLAGPNAHRPIPEEKLRELLSTFDFEFSKRYMRYWQHMALLYHVEGREILVDATHGNIPFLFLIGDETKLLGEYPGKEPLAVRMSLHEEAFYYHRVSQDIPENLLFALEGWIPEADLIQVFENELGLFISEGYFVTAIPYKTQSGFRRVERQYKTACEKVGMQYAISEGWDLDSEIGGQFAEKHPFASNQVLASHQHLLSRYNEREGPGHQAGLVLIKLGA